MNLATLALIEKLEGETVRVTLTLPTSGSRPARAPKPEGGTLPEPEKGQMVLLAKLENNYALRHLLENGTY